MNTDKIVILHKKKATTTSLIVAEKFGKLHKDVLKAIRNLECSVEFIERNFAPIEIDVKVGFGTRKDTAYKMTRDGFMFLAMGFTGKEAGAWKERFIGAFNHYEEVANDPARKSAIQQKRSAHNPMMDAVIFARENFGLNYPSQQVFANENLLCNFVLTGKWSAIDERELDAYDAKLLEAIRWHNGLLAQNNLDPVAREKALIEFTEKYKTKKPRLRLLK